MPRTREDDGRRRRGRDEVRHRPRDRRGRRCRGAQGGALYREFPLVKTALFGGDPNWGRVLAAAGYAGAPFEEAKARLEFNGVLAFDRGVPQPKAGVLNDAMKQHEIEIDLSPGLGDGAAEVYTCDYSYDYVKINAEYHT